MNPKSCSPLSLVPDLPGSPSQVKRSLRRLRTQGASTETQIQGQEVMEQLNLLHPHQLEVACRLELIKSASLLGQSILADLERDYLKLWYVILVPELTEAHRLLLNLETYLTREEAATLLEVEKADFDRVKHYIPRAERVPFADRGNKHYFRLAHILLVAPLLKPDS